MTKVFEIMRALEEEIKRALDEEYRRGYVDGQMELRKEQEATERYWGKKKVPPMLTEEEVGKLLSSLTRKQQEIPLPPLSEA